MNETELLEKCKQANLTVAETELVHWRLIGSQKPISYGEIAKRIGTTAEGAKYKFTKALEKIENL